MSSWWSREDEGWERSSVATLTSFGSPANFKHVRGRNFVLQGNNGGWTTIPSAYYKLYKKLGLVVKRWTDASDNDIDWDVYSAFRWSGSIVTAGVPAPVADEAVTFTDEDDETFLFLPEGDPVEDSYEGQDIVDAGGWFFTDTSIIADNGNAELNSAIPYIKLGNLTGFSDAAAGHAGIWQGKDIADGIYKQIIGSRNLDQYMSWDGSQLVVRGDIVATSVIAGGTTSNVWEINSDNDNVNVDLIFGRATGGDATIRYNGTTVNVDKTLTVGGTTVVLESRTVTAGAGLTGGGALSSNITLNIGAGAGITVNADDVALTTPGTLTVATSNSASGNHTHAITSSSNPGAAASLLATNASGILFLAQLNTDTITDRSGGNLTINPTGDIVFDPQGNDLLPSTNYDLNLGALSKKYLTLHAAELWVETLVAQNTLATVGGRILILPTNILIADVSTGATTIDVKYNNLANGDRIYLEANGAVEFMAVTSGASVISGGYRYSVTRNLDGSGANQWYAGDAIANTGTTGNGWIDAYSVRGVKASSEEGPTIVGNIRNSSTYNDWSTMWAIGNLNGLYGYGAETPGAAFGKYASGNPNITVDATNGIRIRNFTTTIGQWDTSGNITVGEVGASKSNVYITSNKVQLRTNTTVNLELDTGGNITVGNTSTEHVSITSTSVQFKDGVSVYTDLTAGALTIGLVSGGEYVSIEGTNGIRLYGGGVLTAQLTNAGTLTLGQVAASKANIQYDAATGNLNFRTNTTTNLYISTTGYLTFNAISGDGTNTGYAQWVNGSSVKIGQLIGEYGTGTSAGAAAGLEMLGYSDTSGRVGFIQLTAVGYSGSGSSALAVRSDGTFYVDLRAGTNTAAGTQALALKTRIADTNTINILMYLDTETTGTAAAGLGSAISMRAEDDGGSMIEVGLLGFGWKDPAAANRNGVFFLSVADNGTYNEVMRITRAGRFSIGGSGITSSPSHPFEFNDGNDLQANIRADNSAQNDDGWATATIDYGEYVEKRDPREPIRVGEIVYIKGRRASKAVGGTPMIVSTRAGIRGGDPMQWHKKWLDSERWKEEYGAIPETMEEWENRFGKTVRRDEQGEPMPRLPYDARPDGMKVLNPEWNPNETYVSRAERADEWIVVAFAGQVPVRVRGHVNEGDFIVPSGRGDGYGRAIAYATENLLQAVGIAWESKESVGDGMVLCAVGLK